MEVEEILDIETLLFLVFLLLYAVIFLFIKGRKLKNENFKLRQVNAELAAYSQERPLVISPDKCTHCGRVTPHTVWMKLEMQDLKKLNYLLRTCVEARDPKTSHLLNEITSLQDLNRSLNTSANELLNNEDDLRVENMQLWAEVLQLETTLEERELNIRKLRITVREQRELASDLEHSLMVALDELHHQKKQRHKETTKRKSSPTKIRKERKDPLPAVQNAKEEKEKMEQCLEDERDRLRCAVCHDEDRRILLLPCKHFVLCGKCWGGVSRRVRRTCPICNSTVTDAMTIFLS